MENKDIPTLSKAAKNSSKQKGKSAIGDFLFSFKNIFSASQNVIGLDIGFSYIKIVQLQKTRKGYLITNCITRAIPQALRENPAEKRKLTQGFLKEFIADARVKTKLGRFSIWGKGVFVFSLSIPSLNKKDLKGAVSIELKKRLPFQMDINKMMYDFFVTGQTRDEKGVTLQITCIAADQLVLEEQLVFLKEINVRPVMINVVPDALGNLLPFCVPEASQKTVALLDIGANTSQLNFYKGKELAFSREIPVSGESLTRAMVKTITTPSGTSNISFEDAEKIKRNCGIPLEEDSATEYLTDFGALRGDQIAAMLRPTLERLVMEVNRTLNYYVKTFKTENFETLYITGGASRTNNIDRFLLYNLEGLNRVERLDVLKAVKGWADMGVFKQELVMEQAAHHLGVAFGLCLSNGGKVNLLPVREKIEQKIIFFTSTLRILFPIVLTLILSLYAFHYANYLKYKIFIINADAAIERLEPTVKQVREYQNIQSKVEQRKELLKAAKGKEPLWKGILKELSNITPDEVVLEKITVPLEVYPKEVHLFGKISAQYTIVDVALSQFVLILSDSAYFSEVEILSSKTDMYSKVPTANFEIVCKLSY